MRMMLPAFLLSLVHCATSAGGDSGGGSGTNTPPLREDARIEQRYDERNGTTLVRIVPPVPPRGAHLIAGAVVEGREVRQIPDQVLLGVSWNGPAVRFSTCDQVRWRADNERVAEVPITRDVQLGNGVSEFLSGTVSFSHAQALAAAKQISVDVCGIELIIPDTELALLRQLVARMSPPKP